MTDVIIFMVTNLLSFLVGIIYERKSHKDKKSEEEKK